VLRVGAKCAATWYPDQAFFSAFLDPYQSKTGPNPDFFRQFLFFSIIPDVIMLCTTVCSLICVERSTGNFRLDKPVSVTHIMEDTVYNITPILSLINFCDTYFCPVRYNIKSLTDW